MNPDACYAYECIAPASVALRSLVRLWQAWHRAGGRGSPLCCSLHPGGAGLWSCDISVLGMPTGTWIESQAEK